MPTFYKVVRNEGHVPEAYKSVRHETKWDDAHREIVADIISENPLLTLKEIISAAMARGCPRISASTLHAYLDTMLITRKRPTFTAQQRNCPETKEKRVEYANWFTRDENRHYIFVDEFGFSIATQRNYGRGRQGERVRPVTPLMRSPNQSVCMAVSPRSGLLHFLLYDRALDRADFAGFMNALCRILGQDNQNICFILDNCRIHNEADLIQIRDTFGYDYKFLPPYSSQLNPIEEAIGLVKGHIKRLFATDLRDRLLQLIHLPWGQKTTGRNLLLREALARATPFLSRDVVTQYYNHMLMYIPACLAREDIN
jgi:transposase